MDEEREDSAAEGAPVASPLSHPQETPVQPEGHGDLGLSEDEAALLQTLLDGRGYDGPGNVDLMVDAINEALFDLLGDTAIEFGADGEPQLVEDYAEDVRAAL